MTICQLDHFEQSENTKFPSQKNVVENVRTNGDQITLDEFQNKWSGSK